ncbi:MAG: penicillin-binding transpeptidase domain-containing protein [Nocardioidaceae bacterium]
MIADFAEAWPEASATNLRGIVDQPEVAAHDIAAHDAELDITSTRVDLEGDLDCGEDTCREHATVTHELAGSPSWTYKTLIQSKLNQGQWLVKWTPGTFHPDITDATTLKRRRWLPRRAPILDRRGAALTPERKIVRIGVVPRAVGPKTYQELATLVNIDPSSLRERVRAAQPDWFVSVIDLRKKAYKPLRKDILEVPGVTVDKAKRALAPTAAWGRAILGSVGPATAETLGSADEYTLPTDEVGRGGLQQAFQQRLAGTPGTSIQLVEKVRGHVLNRVYTQRAKNGQPLHTTLDVEAQSVVEKSISKVSKPTSVVLVKASTGEILAAGNAPGPTSANTAFLGRVAPGSTFKTVSAAALLAGGVVRPHTRVRCPDTVAVDGKRFKNYTTDLLGPNATFAQAYAASCNTAFVPLASELSGKQLAAMADQFGIGVKWDIGLGAFSGSAPADTDLVTRAADMIGQGHIQESPLGMAMVAATVNSGVARTPTLLPGVKPGRRLGQLSPKLDHQLQQMMRLVVTDGTGKAVDLPGEPVYAKTGTAEVGTGDKTHTNAWMIGYRGDVAFAVYVHGGASGAHAAAPIVSYVLDNLPQRLYR